MKSGPPRESLLAKFDRIALATRGLAYERLDRLTIEILLGVRGASQLH